MKKEVKIHEDTVIISNGGQLESLARTVKLEEIRFKHEGGTIINLWLNRTSLSYLTLSEAIAIRNKLNEAIRSAAGV